MSYKRKKRYTNSLYKELQTTVKTLNNHVESLSDENFELKDSLKIQQEQNSEMLKMMGKLIEDVNERKKEEKPKHFFSKVANILNTYRKSSIAGFIMISLTITAGNIGTGKLLNEADKAIFGDPGAKQEKMIKNTQSIASNAFKKLESIEGMYIKKMDSIEDTVQKIADRTGMFIPIREKTEEEALTYIVDVAEDNLLKLKKPRDLDNLFGDRAQSEAEIAYTLQQRVDYYQEQLSLAIKAMKVQKRDKIEINEIGTPICSLGIKKSSNNIDIFTR